MAEIQDLIPKAVQDALADEGGGLPTAAIVIVEAVLDDGEHYLLTLSDTDLSTWRKMGMLHGAMQDESMRHSADVLVNRIEGDD